MNKILLIAILVLGIGMAYELFRPKKISVIVPPGTNEVEIPRMFRDPMKLKIHTPERKLLVEPK